MNSEMKICKRCGGTYPKYWFRNSQGKTNFVRFMNKAYKRQENIRKSSICKGCERTESDKYKRVHRARIKAWNAIRTHGKKLTDKGIINNPKELIDIYGWDVDIMAHELEHTYSNGCPICHDSFRDMGNGYSDVTLDIKQPNQKPWYGANTQWICDSCNRSKGNLSLEEFGADQYCWDLWKKNQEENKNRIYPELPLFRDITYETDKMVKQISMNLSTR